MFRTMGVNGAGPAISASTRSPVSVVNSRAAIRRAIQPVKAMTMMYPLAVSRATRAGRDPLLAIPRLRGRPPLNANPSARTIQSQGSTMKSTSP
jgi:hypothetical protein